MPQPTPKADNNRFLRERKMAERAARAKAATPKPGKAQLETLVATARLTADAGAERRAAKRAARKAKR